MYDPEMDGCAQIVAEYFKSKDFTEHTEKTPYYHMGATITDSILQAGLNYRCVVYPRVLKLLEEFPDYKTTSDFLILMQIQPLSELIAWRSEEKLKRIFDLTWFLFNQGVEDEEHLSRWLKSTSNAQSLLQIKGIGPKTLDYIGLLSGNQAIAIDRHLFTFLERLGMPNKTYHEAKVIYSKASQILGVSNYQLDQKIWLLMSSI